MEFCETVEGLDGGLFELPGEERGPRSGMYLAYNLTNRRFDIGSDLNGLFILNGFKCQGENCEIVK